jgi:hypothetical protein
MDGKDPMTDAKALTARVVPLIVDAAGRYGDGVRRGGPEHPGVRLVVLLSAHDEHGSAVRGAVASLPGSTRGGRGVRVVVGRGPVLGGGLTCWRWRRHAG